VALLLTYGISLVAAVLVSERARRSVLSTAVLFLAVGLAYGSIAGRPQDTTLRLVAELALVTVLLTDATRTSVQELRSAWRLPGRALLLGFPLTLAGTALVAVLVLGVSWREGLLVGAVLSPTDPVFAAALVGARAIPQPVRHLLNVESGINDGLALPFVIAFLSLVSPQELSALRVSAELAGGVAIGVVVPWLAIHLARTRYFGVTAEYEPLGVLAIGIIVYALSSVVGANPFLASFAAGATVGTISPRGRDRFAPLGGQLVELLKLAALMLLGTVLSGHFIAEVGWRGWFFALLALAAVRPCALALALLGSSLPWRDRLVAGWFGPKGFASVVYGLLVARAHLPDGQLLVHVIGATILLSIVAHSSTDVPVTRWYAEGEEERPGTRA
jgi:NhaP-type Na+/H+ or K+/H+ antiporter